MKSNVRRLVVSALALIAGIAWTPSPAAADPTSGIVTFAFGGTIGESSLAGVNPGDRFSGTFSYDSTLSSGGTIGTFDFSQLPIAHTLSVGAGTFSDTSISSIAPTSPLDEYTIQLTNNGLGQPSTFALTSSMLSGGTVTLTLTDPTGKSFAGNQLPATLSLANLGSATVTYDPPAGSFSGTITSLQQLGQAVPEPASVVLLGLGVAALSVFRPRRQAA